MADIKKSLARISFETVGSIVAIIVGIAALFVAWDEAKSVRKQQAASVLPILKIYTRYIHVENGYEAAVVVENVGVGPAFVESGRTLWDGDYLETVRDGLQNLPNAQHMTDVWMSPLYGTVIGGDSRFDMVSATMPSEVATDDSIAALKASINANLSVEACYCSVYEDCWVSTLNMTGRPDAVDSCETVFEE